MIKQTVSKPADKINGKETAMAITRSSSTTFQVPKTYDMVRSLFDPTLRKSYLELGITFSLILNCWFCYYCTTRFGKEWASCIFLSQYIIWRLSYNLGIGLVLHYQSHYEFLTEFAKRHKLFEKSEKATLLARFCQFEIESKMTPDYDFSSYPPEFNIWLLFRQFVDLVLMQDFTTYMLYVVLSLPEGLTLSVFTHLSLDSVRFYVGIGMLLFNIWVKIDAHRVVKDYAWYWGDFFFLLQDSNLIFDGVFNISPHPMYSIGYLGYYGLSLITGKYQVLLVSIMGHLLQFLFLKYVETPHIERIYGPEQPENMERVDDLIVKNNHNYTKPLMAIHCWYSNFDPLRPTDFITVGSAVLCVLAVLSLSPSPEAMFCFALLVKLSATITNVFILHQQSKNKWFTKLFMRNGYTQLYSYQIWQFIYNYNISLSYLALALQAYTEYKSGLKHDFTTVIFGFILIALHAWSDSEILSAISEFGWFYGDFFLTNYIRRPKLASHGIYRYLNNPECVLGVAGPWGTVLITNFSIYNIILATSWTLSNYIMVTFVEAPHVAKVYGSDVLGRESGVSKALMGFAPIKLASIMVDKFASTLVDMLSVSNDSRGQLEDVVSIALQAATKKMAPNCEFEIYSAKGKITGASGNYTEQNIYIGDKIEVKWKLPANLHHKDDWIGLYKVLETGEDRFRTRISSDGHWCATNSSAYTKNQKASQAVLEFKSNDFFASGRVLFDHNLLYFERGIYEFRYHSTNGHKVLMISPPFSIGFPVVKTDSPKELYQSVTALLKSCNCLDIKNCFNPHANRNFSERTLQKLFRYTTGADISSDYMRRVDYDMEVITKAIFEMKKILDSLH